MDSLLTDSVIPRPFGIFYGFPICSAVGCGIMAGVRGRPYFTIL
jgi:hypothetical protein